MNRFSDAADCNYRLVCEEIVRLVDGAPGRVNGRKICERYLHEFQHDINHQPPALALLQPSPGESDASSYMGSLCGLTLQVLAAFGDRDRASV